VILALSLVALADPVALRAPVEGRMVVAAGAPALGMAWRPADGPAVAATWRWTSGAADLSVGLDTTTGPEDDGWGTAAGVAVGVVALRDPTVGFSGTPWLRLERRGPVRGGVQLAAPVLAHPTRGLRAPLQVELFAGGRVDRIAISALGSAGWAFTPHLPAGRLVLQGQLLVGLSLPERTRSPGSP
jgi:hypothetical protein